MSRWIDIRATFEAHERFDLTASWALEGLPGRPDVRDVDATLIEARSPAVVLVSGRLMEMSDTHSPLVLAWWVERCEQGPVADAELVIDVDMGPRYRYRYDAPGPRPGHSTPRGARLGWLATSLSRRYLPPQSWAEPAVHRT